MARMKSAEHVLSKLSPNLVSMAGTMDKDTIDHIPDLVKAPMIDAISSLKIVEDNAASIVHAQGALNTELPDLKVTL